MCPKKSKHCSLPKYPKCHDRTIRCLEDLPPVHISMERVQNFNTTNILGSVFTYSCKNENFLVDTKGEKHAFKNKTV